MGGPLFGIVPAGQPLITEPSSAPSATSLLYAIPAAAKPSSHIVVFMLPGVVLPENTAAAIYVSTAQDLAASVNPNFRFLGAVGPGKESAIFKVSGTDAGLVIGVSIEPAGSVGERLQGLATAGAGVGSGGQAAAGGALSTAVLAQRIIQNAFNFLASFSGKAGPGGVEVVPLKAFEDWWRKFESRVRSDPSFLERQSD
ncbi:Protein OPI10 [Escovopsis weberi]|uniref:Protein OPI10 n=1 Tax=Escovopsis weberi TaxID=150374 RepID=A0A0M8N646_ESCWE|nr:Protein OPI10 [Escovopsis weberi]